MDDVHLILYLSCPVRYPVSCNLPFPLPVYPCSPSPYRPRVHGSDLQSFILSDVISSELSSALLRPFSSRHHAPTSTILPRALVLLSFFAIILLTSFSCVMFVAVY